ncbi:MAG: histidinol dehydrogenase [Candidatus Dormibacteraeota bacterium]|nr:histidinol dehydrogenase [Candidatus Dormibacteraeota bacterium]
MTVVLRRLTPAEFGEMSRDRSITRDDPDAVAVVSRIVADVRSRGDAAVREWTKRVDGVDLDVTRVDVASLGSAWEQTPQQVRDALERAAAHIREFHEHQRDTTPRGDGSAWLRPEPVRRAGCYVPGGRAAYPSTVLMSVIPAQVAGVSEVVVTSPPAAHPEHPSNPTVHPFVAAAAHLLGVEEVQAIGGAHAVAALAYGTESLTRVDKLVGPGNLYVTLAKRAVFGDVGVDQIAGPSEILVVASSGAGAALIAADLVSQLEHDPLAWAVCLSDDPALLDSVAERFTVAAGAAARSGVIADASENAIAVRCDDMSQAMALVETFAPEHLSLQGTAAEAMRDSVRAAGAIFCGALSPVSIGDYVAGPNHTLPTSGAARYRGPLSVMDFMRWPSIVQLRRADFDELAPIACALAEAEGLPGHAAAIRARMATAERAS